VACIELELAVDAKLLPMKPCDPTISIFFIGNPFYIAIISNE
jgi:hypothetical protein